MALAKQQLTNQQQTFVELLSQGLGKDVAAVGAGYVPGSSAVVLLLQSPHVTRAVERRMRSVLVNDAAPLALRVLQEVAANAEVHPAIRRAAARDLLDRAGYVPPKAASQELADKSIATMSADELAALVNKMEGELAARAKDVSAPDGAPIDDELADMLE